jgi:hypothetical protein
VAALRERRDGLAAGTPGTILLAFDDGVLFEMNTDHGPLVMLSVPYEWLALA